MQNPICSLKLSSYETNYILRKDCVRSIKKIIKNTYALCIEIRALVIGINSFL